MGPETPGAMPPETAAQSGRNWSDRRLAAVPGSQPTHEDPLFSSGFGCPAEPCTQHRCASSCGERSPTWTAHCPHFRAFCLASSLLSVGTAAQTSDSLARNFQTPCNGGTGRCSTRPSPLPGPRLRAPLPCTTAGPQTSGWPGPEDGRPI